MVKAPFASSFRVSKRKDVVSYYNCVPSDGSSAATLSIEDVLEVQPWQQESPIQFDPKKAMLDPFLQRESPVGVGEAWSPHQQGHEDGDAFESASMEDDFILADDEATMFSMPPLPAEEEEEKDASASNSNSNTNTNIPESFICSFCNDIIISAVTLNCGCPKSTICSGCWTSDAVQCKHCHNSVTATVPCPALDQAISCLLPMISSSLSLQQYQQRQRQQQSTKKAVQFQPDEASLSMSEFKQSLASPSQSSRAFRPPDSWHTGQRKLHVMSSFHNSSTKTDRTANSTTSSRFARYNQSQPIAETVATMNDDSVSFRDINKLFSKTILHDEFGMDLSISRRQVLINQEQEEDNSVRRYDFSIRSTAMHDVDNDIDTDDDDNDYYSHWNNRHNHDNDLSYESESEESFIMELNHGDDMEAPPKKKNGGMTLPSTIMEMDSGASEEDDIVSDDDEIEQSPDNVDSDFEVASDDDFLDEDDDLVEEDDESKLLDQLKHQSSTTTVPPPPVSSSSSTIPPPPPTSPPPPEIAPPSQVKESISSPSSKKKRGSRRHSGPVTTTVGTKRPERRRRNTLSGATTSRSERNIVKPKRVPTKARDVLAVSDHVPASRRSRARRSTTEGTPKISSKGTSRPRHSRSQRRSQLMLDEHGNTIMVARKSSPSALTSPAKHKHSQRTTSPDQTDSKEAEAKNTKQPSPQGAPRPRPSLESSRSIPKFTESVQKIWDNLESMDVKCKDESVRSRMKSAASPKQPSAEMSQLLQHLSNHHSVDSNESKPRQQRPRPSRTSCVNHANKYRVPVPTRSRALEKAGRSSKPRPRMVRSHSDSKIQA